MRFLLFVCLGISGIVFAGESPLTDCQSRLRNLAEITPAKIQRDFLEELGKLQSLIPAVEKAAYTHNRLFAWLADWKLITESTGRVNVNKLIKVFTKLGGDINYSTPDFAQGRSFLRVLIASIPAARENHRLAALKENIACALVHGASPYLSDCTGLSPIEVLATIHEAPQNIIRVVTMLMPQDCFRNTEKSADERALAVREKLLAELATSSATAAARSLS